MIHRLLIFRRIGSSAPICFFIRATGLTSLPQSKKDGPHLCRTNWLAGANQDGKRQAESVTLLSASPLNRGGRVVLFRG